MCGSVCHTFPRDFISEFLSLKKNNKKFHCEITISTIFIDDVIEFEMLLMTYKLVSRSSLNLLEDVG